MTTNHDVIPPPREHLDPRARTFWYVSEAIQIVFVFVLAVTGAWAAARWSPLADRWCWLIAAGLVLFTAVTSILSVIYRYRTWRYEIRDDEVDLQYGWLVRTRQLIPMSRIQHVDTRRGPLQHRFGLASVVFYTAAGSMEIPALAQEVAADVRTRISELAKVHDDL